MIVGCFALLEPFAPMRRQFERIRELGFECADLTDNHDGASVGGEYGFTAALSLDSHPADIRDLVDEFGLTLTSVCAHANLIDPPSPSRYGTREIVKAIRLAHQLGIEQVITTEGEAVTPFGKTLTRDEMVFCVRERLYEPIRWAEEFGVELLIEPHGLLTNSVDGMKAVLAALGHEATVGVNFDTANVWLGGTDPVEYVRVFGDRIRHVHWKDLGTRWASQRGRCCGTGMGTIALGDGVVGIEATVNALVEQGFDGPTTLELAGPDNVRRSAERLARWAEAAA